MQFFGKVTFFSLIISSFGFADFKEFYFQRYQARLNHGTSRSEKSTIEEHTFDQRIAPDSCCDVRTFKQRYYIDSSLAKDKAAPVLYYACGEATCEPTSLNGAIREHAKKLGAHLVALEHRYYGKSQPFDKLTAENLQYLSTDNALRDLATFQKFAMADLGLTGKWIVVGGSYPGSLSAYYREKVPQLVVGSLASSAPVQARENFEEYDHHVATVAGDACAAQMRHAVSEIENRLADSELAPSVKKLFAAEEVKDDTDFLYIVADTAAAAVQYGFQKSFCDSITAAETPDDLLKAYGDFAQRVYTMFQVDALKWSMYEGSISEDPNSYDGIGQRQWLYQSCKEYGYWQTAYHDSKISVRSAKINLEYHRGLCDRVFGIKVPVNTDHINKTFYEPLLASSTSNILFTNGSNDPWSTLGISKANGNDQNSNVTVYLVEDAAHCDDLRAPKFTDSQSLKGARDLFESLATEWLK